MTSNRLFKFVLTDGTPVSKSFNVQPTTYPAFNGQQVICGDPLTFIGGATGSILSVFDQVYKVECNQESSNDWFISLSGSVNATASANIVSGSYFTGSISNVYFDFVDLQLDPLSLKRVEITPVNDNIGWKDSFVLGDSLIYFPDANGNLTVPLVPQPTKILFVGVRKNTPFTIFPSGSQCTASQVSITDSGVSQIITPVNQASFGYTAQTSDNRYVFVGGTIDNAISASYAPDHIWTASATVLQNIDQRNNLVVYDSTKSNVIQSVGANQIPLTSTSLIVVGGLTGSDLTNANSVVSIGANQNIDDVTSLTNAVLIGNGIGTTASGSLYGAVAIGDSVFAGYRSIGIGPNVGAGDYSIVLTNDDLINTRPHTILLGGNSEDLFLLNLSGSNILSVSAPGLTGQLIFSGSITASNGFQGTASFAYSASWAPGGSSLTSSYPFLQTFTVGGNGKIQNADESQIFALLDYDTGDIVFSTAGTGYFPTTGGGNVLLGVTFFGTPNYEQCIALGGNALASAVGAKDTVAIGHEAGDGIIYTCKDGVYIGHRAQYFCFNDTGSVVIGHNAGPQDSQSSSYAVFIGEGAQSYGIDTQTNTIAIGWNAFVNKNNMVHIGNSASSCEISDSLFRGTASYATTAGTASLLLGNVSSATFAVSASWASSSLSSSYAGTASVALNASTPTSVPSASWVSASAFITTAQTASFVTASNVIGAVTTAQTAYVANSINFVPVASLSSSWVSASAFITTAQTASFVTASNIQGYVANASHATTADTASFATASNIIGAVTTAQTAYVANSINFVPAAATSASWVSSSATINTSSFAVTSSFALNASASLTASCFYSISGSGAWRIFVDITGNLNFAYS